MNRVTLKPCAGGVGGGVIAFPLYNSTTPRWQEGCGKKGEREREREREKPLRSIQDTLNCGNRATCTRSELRDARVQVAGGLVQKFQRKCSYMGTREVARYSVLHPLTAVDSCRL